GGGGGGGGGGKDVALEGAQGDEGTEGWGEGGAIERVPDYRLNGFVHSCPLLSEGIDFANKAWLEDEDDG
ncbi:unnamed protein product, partial [Choristocarpus tenellus]